MNANSVWFAEFDEVRASCIEVPRVWTEQYVQCGAKRDVTRRVIWIRLENWAALLEKEGWERISRHLVTTYLDFVHRRLSLG